MKLITIKKLRSSKYWNVIAKVYKRLDGKYQVVLQSWAISWVGVGKTAAEAVKDAYNKFKINFDQALTGNKIMFGENVDKFFWNNWNAVEKYVENRNKRLANIVFKKVLDAFKANPPKTYEDFVRMRDKILMDTIAQYWWQVDWNNPNWKNTIDNIYRNMLITFKKKWIPNWEAFYKKVISAIKKKKAETPPNQNEIIKKTKWTELNIDSVEKAKWLNVDLDTYNQKLNWIKQKFLEMWRPDLAKAVELMQSEVEATKQAKNQVLESYKQLMQNIQQQMWKLSEQYWIERQFIDNWLTQKFGELKQKLQGLDELAKENLNKKIQLITQQIANKSNILEGMQRKWKVSVWQELAASAEVWGQFLDKIQKAYEDYYNQLRRNTQDYYNLYKTWLNELQQSQATWAKPLYDLLYNQAAKLYGGLHWTTENWLNKEVWTIGKQATNIANLTTTAYSQNLQNKQLEAQKPYYDYYWVLSQATQKQLQNVNTTQKQSQNTKQKQSEQGMSKAPDEELKKIYWKQKSILWESGFRW